MGKTRKHPAKILVIEDDPDILNALNIMLGSAGFDVDVLLKGGRILENQFVQPDLFIIDKRLPDVDGLEICRFLKTKANYRGIPVIVISASPRLRKKALDAGASCFIPKPFTMQELVNSVVDTLKKTA